MVSVKRRLRPLTGLTATPALTRVRAWLGHVDGPVRQAGEERGAPFADLVDLARHAQAARADSSDAGAPISREALSVASVPLL